MDGSVDNIEGAVIDWIQTSRWCRRIKMGVFLDRSNSLKEMDGSVGGIVSKRSERRVALVPLDKDGVIFWLSVQIPLKKPMGMLEVSF